MSLVDIEIVNEIFTWNSHKGGKHQIALRLDIFSVLESILEVGIFLEPSTLPSAISMHWPICLEIDIKASPKNEPFRSKHFWIKDPSLP